MQVHANITETYLGVIHFVLYGHCQNSMDDHKTWMAIF